MDINSQGKRWCERVDDRLWEENPFKSKVGNAHWKGIFNLDPYIILILSSYQIYGSFRQGWMSYILIYDSGTSIYMKMYLRRDHSKKCDMVHYNWLVLAWVEILGWMGKNTKCGCFVYHQVCSIDKENFCWGDSIHFTAYLISFLRLQ